MTPGKDKKNKEFIRPPEFLPLQIGACVFGLGDSVASRAWLLDGTSAKEKGGREHQVEKHSAQLRMAKGPSQLKG